MVCVDRTAALLQAVRECAARMGKSAGEVTALLQPPPLKRPPRVAGFTREAQLTGRTVSRMEAFLLEHRAAYVSPGTLSQRERDEIEAELGQLIRKCKESIEVLSAQLVSDKVDRRGREQQVAAHHGVVLILSERLAQVSKDFDRMRARRYEQALREERKDRRRGLVEAVATFEKSVLSAGGEGQTTSLPGEPDSLPRQHPLRMQEVVRAEHDRRIVEELESMADGVKEAERKILEMSALNHLFSTHIVEQAQQLEHLYNQVSAHEARPRARDS